MVKGRYVQKDLKVIDLQTNIYCNSFEQNKINFKIKN